MFRLHALIASTIASAMLAAPALADDGKNGRPVRPRPKARMDSNATVVRSTASRSIR